MRRDDNIIQNYRPSDKDVLLGITPLIAYQFCDTSYQSYQNGFSAPNEYDWAMTALASFVVLGILSRFVNWGYNTWYGDQSFQRNYPKTQKVTTVLAQYSTSAAGVFLTKSLYDEIYPDFQPFKLSVATIPLALSTIFRPVESVQNTLETISYYGKPALEIGQTLWEQNHYDAATNTYTLPMTNILYWELFSKLPSKTRERLAMNASTYQFLAIKGVNVLNDYLTTPNNHSQHYLQTSVLASYYDNPRDFTENKFSEVLGEIAKIQGDARHRVWDIGARLVYTKIFGVKLINWLYALLLTFIITAGYLFISNMIAMTLLSPVLGVIMLTLIYILIEITNLILHLYNHYSGIYLALNETDHNQKLKTSASLLNTLTDATIFFRSIWGLCVMFSGLITTVVASSVVPLSVGIPISLQVIAIGGFGLVPIIIGWSSYFIYKFIPNHSLWLIPSTNMLICGLGIGVLHLFILTTLPNLFIVIPVILGIGILSFSSLYFKSTSDELNIPPNNVRSVSTQDIDVADPTLPFQPHALIDENGPRPDADEHIANRNAGSKLDD